MSTTDLEWLTSWPPPSELDLRGVDLSGQDLSELEIKTSKLEDAIFDRAILDGAVFSDCHMRKVAFRGAQLQEVRFQACDLRGAVFAGSKLREVHFEACDLDEADLREVDLDEVSMAHCRGTPALAEKLRIWDTEVSAATWLAVAQGRTRGITLRGRPRLVSGLDLRDADLEGVDLRRAELEDLRLEGANLRGATLRGIDLQRSSLVGADLREADLQDAVLVECDLTDARFDGANLRGASWEECTAVRTSLRGIRANDKTYLGRIVDVDLSGEDLRKVVHESMFSGLVRVSFRGADLRGTALCVYEELTECDFRDIRGERMCFFDSDWQDSLFEGANFRRAFLGGTFVEGMVLTGMDLRETEFVICLDGADLSGLDLRGAKFTLDSSAAGARFIGANLRRAEIGGLDLRRASLVGADLGDVDFRNARLGETTLVKAKISGAVFWEDQLELVDLTEAVGRPKVMPIPGPR